MPQKRIQRATIQDVAKAAGVSVSSVSHYQNGRRHHLREETMERIRKSIEALNYTPSRVARQLKSGQTPMVGLLIPSIDNPYHAELALALDDASEKVGFRLVLGNGHRDQGREKAFIDELVDYGVRGFIVTSELRDTPSLRDYLRRGIAFVLFDVRLGDLDGDGVDVVSIDNRQATAIAVDHLVALGHRSIAFVTTTPFSANRRERLEGFVSALTRHGLDASMVITGEGLEPFGQGDSDLASFGESAARELLRRYPQVTAVIGINGIVTTGILAGLRQSGKEVPDDISLVGIDDIKLSSMIAPALTTIKADYRAMAEQAVSFLRSRLADPREAGRESIYTPELVRRQSTKSLLE